LILDTLNSIRNQSFVDYELIIIDDGSTDNTKEVVENYIAEIGFKNWYYYYKTNGERGAARNYGVERAKGQFVTFLDSDDLFYSNHLELANAFLVNKPSVEIFHSAYEFKNLGSNITKKVSYPSYSLNEAILKGNIISCFGVFLKKEILFNYPFSEDRKLSGSEDWLLWLELLPKHIFYFQNIVTGCMIEHEQRSVLNFNEGELKNRADLLFHALLNNSEFIKKFGIKTVNAIYAHMLTYAALHLVLLGKRKEGILMLILAIKMDYSELFKKRTLGILKNMY
jgi:glycosyltransferase involved in cell wall biosynthesis